MTTRFATATVAIVLSLAAPAAFAQAGNWPHSERAAVSAYDDITTGSIGIARPQQRDGWGAVSSAKAGNANQQNFPVQQYGQTSGGPAY
ncbi:hypothetical protein [Methylobacterium gregans]|uniref:DUF4148 domain-containing protein n=1 Tax=Methylobacterium gregans TaxID=374424 RepID=A0AA37HRF5_9HYPH|nr:hypothetical protein [Methylobacterium gregans]MDQ0520164.1 hypothetical protein [Methylobacterium gregans]GJD80455.1 hypothetical protein NBEOAGPD_3696 [Methylobacterium gregans]GLS52567.1 hypothetical protein GCM10007886_07500 [Methylobacterium gregans]